MRDRESCVGNDDQIEVEREWENARTHKNESKV